MALTKVGKEGVTGLSNSSDATAITIDSSENVSFNGGVTIGGTTGSSQLSFLSATDSTNTINFGDSGDADIGNIQYNHSTNNMDFHANTDKVMRVQGSSGIIVQGENEDWCAQFRSSDSSGTRYFLDFRIDGTIDGSAGTQVGYVLYNGSSTVYNTSSDYRLKQNVSYTWDATTRLKQLKPCRFNFISNPSNTVDGFLAHEVSSFVPESIHGEKDAVDSEGNIIPQGIDHSKLVPLLVKTIQELEARITALESK